MGIYDRDYYRDTTRNSLWLSGENPVARNLIIANVVVFVLQLFVTERRDLREVSLITEWLNLDPQKVLNGEVWRLLTSIFVHSVDSPFHIVMNMLVLWTFSTQVEPVLGKREFLLFYLGAGLTSSLISLAFKHILNDPVPTVGASGAINGVMVLYAMYWPTRVLLIFGALPMEARWLVGILLTLDVVPAICTLAGVVDGDFRDHFAHLGGAFLGYAYYRSRWKFERILPNLKNRFRSRSIRVYRPPEEDINDLRAKVDEILQKISRDGESSLTESERATLKRASTQFKNRR